MSDQDFDQLDEISQERLKDYHAKAALDLKGRREKLDKGTLTMKDLKKGQNRVTGLNRSANKMEEVEYMDEVKATGENSMANDPVTPAGGTAKGKNRPADKNMSVDPTADNIEDTVKTPQGTAAGNVSPAEGPGQGKKAPPRMADKKAMKESVEEMFAGQDLSEEFKERVTVVFEAAVNARLVEEVERIEEEFAAQLDEQVEIAVNDLVEKVDSYLDYVVEKWMEENELAVESGLRTAMAESFMNGLYDLFVEHHVSLPEEGEDILESLVQELDEVKEKLNEEIDEKIELRKQLIESRVQDVFEEISEGLTDTQVEKLQRLAEGIEYGDLDEFKSKVSIIKENYFGGKDYLSEETDELDPIEEETQNMKAVDPAVARYAEAISRNLRK